MPYFFRMDGDISVILWRRKASQPWELPGKKPAEGESEHRAFYWQPQHHLTTTIVGYMCICTYVHVIINLWRRCYVVFLCFFHKPHSAKSVSMTEFCSITTKDRLKTLRKCCRPGKNSPRFVLFLLLLVYLMEWGIAVHLLVCFLSKGITGNPNDPSHLDKQFVCFG